MHPNAGGRWNPTAFPLPVRVIREGTLRLPPGDGAAKEIRLGHAGCQLSRADPRPRTGKDFRHRLGLSGLNSPSPVVA